MKCSVMHEFPHDSRGQKVWPAGWVAVCVSGLKLRSEEWDFAVSASDHSLQSRAGCLSAAVTSTLLASAALNPGESPAMTCRGLASREGTLDVIREDSQVMCGARGVSQGRRRGKRWFSKVK